MSKWKCWSRYAAGTDSQQKMIDILQREGIMDKLSEWDPVVIGTIPINVDTVHSDVDIAIQVEDIDRVEEYMRNTFSAYPEFALQKIESEFKKGIVVSFVVEGVPIEIYGENKPVECQNGYRHMVIEERFLELGGDMFRRAVLDLKHSGVKTEPAFAKLLGIENDPYDSLLMYYHRSDGAYLDALAKFTKEQDATQHLLINDDSQMEHLISK